MGRGMTLQQQVDRQRVKYIVSSFRLAGDEATRFTDRLEALFDQYPLAWLELAIAEVVVLNWLIVPMPRGLEVIRQVQNLLRQWERHGVNHLLNPQEFQRVTGLDPNPVFQALTNPALLQH
jgi:hypothetical protein